MGQIKMDLFVFSFQFESFFSIYIYSLSGKSLCINDIMRLSVNRAGNLRSHIYQNDVKSSKCAIIFYQANARHCASTIKKNKPWCDVFYSTLVVEIASTAWRRMAIVRYFNEFDFPNEANDIHEHPLHFFAKLAELVFFARCDNGMVISFVIFHLKINSNQSIIKFNERKWCENERSSEINKDEENASHKYRYGN